MLPVDCFPDAYSAAVETTQSVSFRTASASRAASFNDDRLRQAPVGHFFDAMTNGWGAMPSYAAQIPVHDRWAIIAYLRALQLSHVATIDDVPQDLRAGLKK